jgi:flagellar biosynthesis protein FlhB
MIYLYCKYFYILHSVLLLIIFNIYNLGLHIFLFFWWYFTSKKTKYIKLWDIYFKKNYITALTEKEISFFFIEDFILPLFLVLFLFFIFILLILRLKNSYLFQRICLKIKKIKKWCKLKANLKK